MSRKMIPIEPVTRLAEVTQLLSACELPVADIAASGPAKFFGCHADSGLVGVVGLEVYGTAALLRSLAVAPAHRKGDLGKALVSFAEARAASLGVQSLYLLTTTAQGYFAQLGYSLLSRDDAPASIKATAQFAGLCPASSAFMGKQMDGDMRGN
jgi:amino-acid N-acetyltransferase